MTKHYDPAKDWDAFERERNAEYLRASLAPMQARLKYIQKKYLGWKKAEQECLDRIQARTKEIEEINGTKNGEGEK